MKFQRNSIILFAKSLTCFATRAHELSRCPPEDWLSTSSVNTHRHVPVLPSIKRQPNYPNACPGTARSQSLVGQPGWGTKFWTSNMSPTNAIEVSRDRGWDREIGRRHQNVMATAPNPKKEEGVRFGMDGRVMRILIILVDLRSAAIILK